MLDLIRYSLIGSVIIATFAGYWYLVAGRRLFASATNWFMLMQSLFMFGTIGVVNLDETADAQWLIIVVGGVSAFTAGAIAINYLVGFNPRAEIDRFLEKPVLFDLAGGFNAPLIYSMAFVCVAAGTWFATVVGGNVFVWALTNYIHTGGEIDWVQYVTMRTAITTGREGYVAPGYSLQFSGVLFPLVLYLLYFRVRYVRSGLESFFVFLLLIANIYFLTIYGSRGWVMWAVLGFLLLISPFGPFPALWRSWRRTAYAIVGTLGVFYIASTTLMGRTAMTGSFSEGSGLIRAIVTSVIDFYDRLIGDYSKWMLMIMRFLMQRPVAWGQEWWDALATVLPGATKGYGFSNEMHEVLYGSGEGNAGLNVWASMGYNWGVAGSLVCAFVVGMLIQGFTIAYVRGERRMSRSVILFVAGYRFAMFRDPYSLLLEGFCTILVFYAIFLAARAFPLGVVGSSSRKTHAALPG